MEMFGNLTTASPQRPGISPKKGGWLSGFLLFFFLFFGSLYIIHERAVLSADKAGSRAARSIEDRMEQILGNLEGLHAFFRASKLVEPHEFSIFCEELRRNHPLITWTAWISKEDSGSDTKMMFPSTAKRQEKIFRQARLEASNRKSPLKVMISEDREIVLQKAATPTDGMIFIAVNAAGLLPEELGGEFVHYKLLLSNRNAGSEMTPHPVYITGEASVPIRSIQLDRTFHVHALDCTWSFQTRFQYPIETEDFALMFVAIFPSVLFGFAVFSFLGAKADRALQHEQRMRSQRMELLGTIAGGIVHDFNNVLSGIVGTLSLVREIAGESRAIQSSDIQHPLDVMERAAARGQEIVARLLTFAKPSTDPGRCVDLMELMNEVEELARGSVGRSVRILLEPWEQLDEPPLVNGNSTQLEQAFLNLVINGAHAMSIMQPFPENGGGDLSLSIEVFHPDRRFIDRPRGRFIDRHVDVIIGGTYWKVNVKDTGVGMDAGTMAELFTPFFTTKSREQGTGLGLSCVYSIVKAHSGFIEVSSTVGKGTTFSVYLPAANASRKCAARRSTT